MKQVSVITGQALAGMGQQQVSQPAAAPSDEGTARVVNALFRTLKATFPAWKQAWPTADAEAAARREWIKAFAAAGIRRVEQLRWGVEACRASDSDFMPSPGKFVAWCRPSAQQLGCPAVEQAFLQACQLAHPAADRSSAHPAVWHAAHEAGLHALGTLPENRSRPLFERAYSLTLGMIERGEALREIPKALPASVHVPASPDKVSSALESMRKKLKGVA